MGDHLRAGMLPRHVTKPTRLTQLCIPPAWINQVPALIGWDKGENVTSAGWQVTLCNSIWHTSSRSGEGLLQTAILRLPLSFTHLCILTN